LQNSDYDSKSTQLSVIAVPCGKPTNTMLDQNHISGQENSDIQCQPEEIIESELKNYIPKIYSQKSFINFENYEQPLKSLYSLKWGNFNLSLDRYVEIVFDINIGKAEINDDML